MSHAGWNADQGIFEVSTSMQSYIPNLRSFSNQDLATLSFVVFSSDYQRDKTFNEAGDLLLKYVIYRSTIFLPNGNNCSKLSGSKRTN